MRVLVSASLAVALAVIAAAQDQPDFSGHWVLVDPLRPGADVARSLTIRQPIVRTTARGAPMPPAFLELTVERQSEQAVRAESYMIGSEGGSSSGGPGVGETRVSVLWRGDRLFIATHHTTGPSRDATTTTEHTEEWSFDERGRLVIVVVDREGDAQPTL